MAERPPAENVFALYTAVMTRALRETLTAQQRMRLLESMRRVAESPDISSEATLAERQVLDQMVGILAQALELDRE